MSAKPFMRPAMEPNIDKATAVVAAQLDKSIEKIIKSGAA